MDATRISVSTVGSVRICKKVASVNDKEICGPTLESLHYSLRHRLNAKARLTCLSGLVMRPALLSMLCLLALAVRSVVLSLSVCRFSRALLIFAGDAQCLALGLTPG